MLHTIRKTWTLDILQSPQISWPMQGIRMNTYQFRHFIWHPTWLNLEKITSALYMHEWQMQPKFCLTKYAQIYHNANQWSRSMHLCMSISFACERLQLFEVPHSVSVQDSIITVSAWFWLLIQLSSQSLLAMTSNQCHNKGVVSLTSAAPSRPFTCISHYPTEQ